MSDTLNRRYEAHWQSDLAMYDKNYLARLHPDDLEELRRQSDTHLDAADAAVNIEAAAEALWEDETPVLGLPQPWDKQDEGLKHEYRVAARRTVATALGRQSNE